MNKKRTVKKLITLKKQTTQKRRTPLSPTKKLKDTLVKNLTAIGFEQECRIGGKIGLDSSTFSLAYCFSMIWIKHEDHGVEIGLSRPRARESNCDLEYTFKPDGGAKVSLRNSDPLFLRVTIFKTWDDGIAHFLHALTREVQRMQKDSLAMARRLHRRKWPYVK